MWPYKPVSTSEFITLKATKTMDSASLLLWSVLFGGIGTGYFIYGKKQRAIVPLCTGIALLVFPYFVPTVTLLVLVGVVLVAIPYFIRL
jgi:hypothetical protein